MAILLAIGLIAAASTWIAPMKRAVADERALTAGRSEPVTGVLAVERIGTGKGSYSIWFLKSDEMRVGDGLQPFAWRSNPLQDWEGRKVTGRFDGDRLLAVQLGDDVVRDRTVGVVGWLWAAGVAGLLIFVAMLAVAWCRWPQQWLRFLVAAALLATLVLGIRFVFAPIGAGIAVALLGFDRAFKAQSIS